MVKHSTSDFLNMDLPNSTMNATKAPGRPPQEYFCSLPTESEFKFQTTFLILILILTFVGNLLVVLAVIFFRRLRYITNYFIVSLAVSDLLISIFLPFRIDQTIHNAHWCLSKEFCRLWIVIETTCSYASMWNLAIISIDRYTAIVHPFRYHSIITNKVGYGLISFVWGFSFTLALMALMNWTSWEQERFLYEPECGKKDKYYYTISAAISFYLPLLIVLVMYGFVFRVAFNQAKAMAALQVSSNNRGRRSSINLVKEVKAAKTLAIVIGCFVVCWFPFSVLLQISLWAKEELILPLSRDVKVGLSLTFIYALPALNSTLNPIIYALFNREFRQAFIKLAKRMTGQPLGAVGFGESTMTGTTVSKADNGVYHSNQNRAIRFQDHDSESSEVPPTIPMRDPNAFYNDSCIEIPANGSTLAAPHDTNSMETTLDDDRPTQCPSPNSKDTADAKTPQCNGAGGGGGNVHSEENPSRGEIPQKLPPLERDGSKSTDDDVDLGAGGLAKPLTLPPIESTNTSELNPSLSPARSERSELSSSSLVNVAEHEDKTCDITDSVL
ncbi:D(1) dopamine receptor-like [Actinia tenebrosa]|uniref:D(1) dopamine receptor-like n=1 Tax=Actinia tenebrosa TaxID=6105 RepID=A0A6P8HEW1_ACTTE|nr:D(1) dopamine receptor-like [Actinia tenebrosa]XP_031551158.1 D(1) dopamine receptor-like [Actinia tenebrosa]XP_031551159.1 D(1) dopamine receptor-like [Actinia tenebrosa]XP_031551160.1 D(1) dopamine receptor-like [Actinia tenebrosa]XP_031551161.1 D(1) dopamine receptor-like [Actinia tenebrosa]XP_031551162.1 D(1) dopamine receptor-like [Actinia tenebrosa]XP_031551163.1 D(1) dopamine receptor-like [Actinia tenebrosa]